ncbi:MAG: hypothetical protein N2A97_06990 [Thermodesulfobacteriales bacterium]
MSRNVIMIAVIVVIAGYLYFKSTDKSQQIVSPQTSQEQVATGSDSQNGGTEDEILVEGLIKDGIVSRIEEDGNTPKVYITADFYRIPNVDKKNIFIVIFKDLQSKNPEVTSLTVYDDKSGDKVGTYDSNGFKHNEGY